ncbi:hypothetical protein DFQ26_007560 [Actinomortierella ambigua]|nr:hypothetical protein DFQ26_007560 [Actinomortierella ambigua]
MASMESTALATSPTTRRPPQLRNLQPRAAAAIDFNDSDDDDGLLSADYKAQRKTERDLVEFFKNTPPPPPAPTILLSPFPDDDKKKRGLLQRLRPRKGSASLGSTNGSRSSVTMSGNTSSISARSAYTLSNRSPVGSTVGMEHGADVATLPNGKKYVMIAVDYKDGTGPGAPTTSIAPASSVSPGARISSDDSRQRVTSVVQQQPHPNIQVTTTIDDNSSIGPDKRRSIIIQAGGGDGAAFSLEQTPFLLDNFALDMDFILHPNTNATNNKHAGSTPSSPSTPSPQSNLSSHYHQMQQSPPQRTQSVGQNATAEAIHQHQHHIRKRSTSTPSIVHSQQAAIAAAGQPHRQHHRSPSSKSGQSSHSADDDLRRHGSRQRNKVTFSTAMQHIHPREDSNRARDDEQIVADALMRRLAAYKAQQERADGKELSRASANAAKAVTTSHQQQQDQLAVMPEITLPKPVSRRKVRHVQIQTQHCIMRPMYSQTDPLTDEYDPQDWPSSSRSTTTTTTTTTAMMTTTIATTTMTTSSASTSTSTSTDTGTDAAESLTTLGSCNNSNNNSSVALSCITSTAASSGQPRSEAASPPSTPTTMKTTTSATAVSTVMGNSPTTIHAQDMTSYSSSPTNLAKENEQLRQQVAIMQSQMQKMERELASETRARARTTAAMQDTREKFEMLSAMAYKKLKELIFQRHVLEMEVRELRVQVDLQNDEQDLGHHHHHHHHHHQQQSMTPVAG